MKLRSWTPLVFGLIWTVGYCAVGPLAYWLRHWRYLMLAVSGPIMIFGLLYYFILPESFHFLISKNKIPEVNKWLRKVNQAARWKGTPHTNVQAKDLCQHAPSNENKNTGSKAGLFRQLKNNRQLSIYTLVFVYLWTCDNFVYYGLSLFSTQLSGNRYLNFALVALIEIPSYVSSPFLLNRLGRKLFVSLCHLLASASFFAIIFLGASPEFNLAMWLVGKFGITCAFTGLFVYASEVFPTVVRNGCIGLCNFVAGVGGACAPAVRTMSLISPIIPILFFGTAAGIAALITLILPETLNRELPDLAEQINKKFKSELNTETRSEFKPFKTKSFNNSPSIVNNKTANQKKKNTQIKRSFENAIVMDAGVLMFDGVDEIYMLPNFISGTEHFIYILINGWKEMLEKTKKVPQSKFGAYTNILHQYFEEQIQQGFAVPNHLKDFAKSQSAKLAKSVIQAFLMQPNRDYFICNDTVHSNEAKNNLKYDQMRELWTMELVKYESTLRNSQDIKKTQKIIQQDFQNFLSHIKENLKKEEYPYKNAAFLIKDALATLSTNSLTLNDAVEKHNKVEEMLEQAIDKEARFALPALYALATAILKRSRLVGALEMDLQMNAIRQLLAANGDYSEDEEFADELSVNEENAVQQEQIVEAVEEVEQPVETVPSQKSNLKLVILMFGRSSASTWIHKVRKIYIDGTFRIASHHFYQIFVIMGERSGFVLPLLYVLLPNKSEACYMKMFEMVKNLWPRFQPTSASLDYEMVSSTPSKNRSWGSRLVAACSTSQRI
uniref:Uncharacterized protein n=1 Tax=Ditylenchus dipsaci TaxID=166011 RepID=A0A915D4Y3_9BILA